MPLILASDFQLWKGDKVTEFEILKKCFFQHFDSVLGENLPWEYHAQEWEGDVSVLVVGIYPRFLQTDL